MQPLADRGSSLWTIFSPLAVDATAGSMIEVLRALRGRIDEERSLRLGPAQRARIERESHEDVLLQWFRRALLAQRTAELFVASASSRALLRAGRLHPEDLSPGGGQTARGGVDFARRDPGRKSAS